MTGGGTGGHVYPALAIASVIKQNDPQAEIAFVGTPSGMENKLVGAAGYKMYHVDVKGFRRSLSPNFSLPGFLLHEILQARILEWVATSFSRGSS